MIPVDAVTEWGAAHDWPTPEQIEQDLLLSRAICAIANDDYLGNELVFRGGTAFHKLHLAHAWRYSEDLDYVRTSASGIKDLTTALSRLGAELEYDVATRITRHPKIYWRTQSHTGGPLRIKIEVNTHERSPALPHAQIPHKVRSQWWTGTAAVRTFQPVELVSTKIRALYQRKKGRDLFDLWLALTKLHLPPADLIAAFDPYRPAGFAPTQAVANLREKLHDPNFRSDLDPLLGRQPDDYDIEEAGELIIDQILTRL